MWIESHQSLRDHPKVKRLARKLGISKKEAIGTLHFLWWWALDYAPKGFLIPPFTAEDVVDAVEISDIEPREVVDALIYAGFLDRDGDRITLHDWHDYAGKLLDKREKDRKRKEAQRRHDG